MRQLVLILLASVLLTAQAQIPTPRPSDIQPEQQQTQPHAGAGTTKAPVTQLGALSVRIENAEKNKEKVDAYAAEQERESSDTDTARLAWVAIALTAIQAIIFAFTLKETNRIARGAEDTAQRQLRAYPGINWARMEIRGDKVSAEIRVQNSSSTPAYKFRHAIIHEICVAGTEDFKAPVWKDTQWDMIPGAITTLRINEPITYADAEDIRNERKLLIVSGKFEYTDAFDEPRWTEFRYRNGRFVRQVEEPSGVVYFVSGEPEAIDFHST